MARQAKKVEVKPVELTEEQRTIIEAAELRQELEALRTDPVIVRMKFLEARYDIARKTLRDAYRAGLVNGRNSPMSAPGWLITWRAKEMPEQPARTDHIIVFNRLVPVE